MGQLASIDSVSSACHNDAVEPYFQQVQNVGVGKGVTLPSSLDAALNESCVSCNALARTSAMPERLTLITAHTIDNILDGRVCGVCSGTYKQSSTHYLVNSGVSNAGDHTTWRLLRSSSKAAQLQDKVTVSSIGCN